MGIQSIKQFTLSLRYLKGIRVPLSPSSNALKGVQALILGLLTSFGKARSRRFSIPSVLTLTILSATLGFSIFSHSAYATSYINVSSGSGGTVSLGSIRPSSSGTSSTGSDTLTIHTDCSTGYSVYVSGQKDKDTNLTNSSTSSNNIIATSSTAVGSTATALNANTWGLNSENTGAYVGLPTYANATTKALVSKSSVSESSTVPIYYGVKVDTSLTPGTYTGNVLYTVMMDSSCLAYTVVFNSNGGSGTMSNQSIMTGTATNLNMNTYTRSGYMFLGWAESSSATTPIYKDGESVTDLAASGGTKTLYAVWGKSTGNMQDFKCTDLASGTTTYLTDTRDNQVYSVYRIPVDQTYAGTSTVANVAGKCLMTKDLNLGAVNSVSGASSSITANGTMTISPNDSGFTTPTGSGETITVPTESVTISNTYSDTNSYSNKYYKADGTGDYAGRGYYSWGAAMVVCPKGWRLPTADEYSDSTSWEGQAAGLAAIVKGANAAETITNITSSPYSFVLGGRYNNSNGFNSAPSYGNYWSSTQSNSSFTYSLYMYSSNGLLRNQGSKSVGYSVRCMAEDNYTISYSADGADSGEASKTSEVVYENGSATMPTAGTMTKSGYEFKGWALTSGASEAAYQAEESVPLTTLLSAASSAGQTTTPGSTIALYPVWEQKIDGTMQAFNCANLASGGTANLQDTRDGQVYSVYRIPTDQTYAGASTLANVAGKCIMTKDLNLGAVAFQSSASSKMTSANSTMTLSLDDSGFTTPTGSGESITVATPTASVSNTYSSTDSYSNRYYNANGTGYYAGRGYYSWGAAMVVCPKGWRIPTGDEYNNSGSWESSTTGISAIVKGPDATATISNITGNPYFFVFSGIYSNGFYNAPSEGYYWSSTQYDSSTARYLSMEPSYGLILRGTKKRTGSSVRCISDPITATMQDFKASSFSTTVGTSTQLVDSRDGKVYTVKRLPDGKVWMMQNLTVNGVALTPDNTNIDNGATYYLPKDGGRGSITASSTANSTSGYNFNSSNSAQASFKLRTKDSSIRNDSDTGYYNFYTATLGFSSYNDNVSSGSSTRDICPKGWRLPKTTDQGTSVSTTGTANDFTNLARTYNTDNWSGTSTLYDYYTSNTTVKNYMYIYAASPLATMTQNRLTGLSYSGYWSGAYDSASSVGAEGHYWSSSVRASNASYYLFFDSSNIYPQSGDYKFSGNAVRCVAKS